MNDDWIDPAHLAIESPSDLACALFEFGWHERWRIFEAWCDTRGLYDAQREKCIEEFSFAGAAIRKLM